MRGGAGAAIRENPHAALRETTDFVINLGHLINVDQVGLRGRADTPAQRTKEVSLSTSPIADTGPVHDDPRAERRMRLVESLLDNLPAWTVIAAAIAMLYLIWATLVILDKYVGEIPKVVP